MKRKGFAIGLTTSLLCLAGNASAGTAYGGNIVAFHFMGDVVVLSSTGSRHGAPLCRSVPAGRFALNVTTARGKAQLAGLLMAYASGRPLAIYGTGTCSAWPDAETVDYFYTID